MDSDGFAENTAWVKPDDAFLVRDLNGNGTIDNIGEMFGNATTSGFAALKTYADSNNDNKINSLDTNFGQLKIWRDLDGDGITDAGELQTLTASGIKEIRSHPTTMTVKSFAAATSWPKPRSRARTTLPPKFKTWGLRSIRPIPSISATPRSPGPR